MEVGKLSDSFKKVGRWLVILIAFSLGARAVKSFTKPNETAQDLIKSYIASESKNLPQMVDSSTRLERLSQDGNRITYHVTFVDISSKEFAAIPVSFISALKRANVDMLCSQKAVVALMNKGVIFAYECRSSDGVQVFRIETAAKDCK